MRMLDCSEGVEVIISLERRVLMFELLVANFPQLLPNAFNGNLIVDSFLKRKDQDLKIWIDRNGKLNHLGRCCTNFSTCKTKTTDNIKFLE